MSVGQSFWCSRLLSCKETIGERQIWSAFLVPTILCLWFYVCIYIYIHVYVRHILLWLDGEARACRSLHILEGCFSVCYILTHWVSSNVQRLSLARARWAMNLRLPWCPEVAGPPVMPGWALRQLPGWRLGRLCWSCGMELLQTWEDVIRSLLKRLCIELKNVTDIHARTCIYAHSHASKLNGKRKHTCTIEGNTEKH